MDNSQVFLILFLQNVLNFFSLYFFINKYSRIVNDINIHFEKTTRLFLDHLSDMYEYSWDYWRRSRYDEEDEDCEDTEDCDDDTEDCGEDTEDTDYTEDCGDVQVEEDHSSCGSSVNTTCVQGEETFSQNCI